MEDGGIVFVIMGLVFGPGIVAFLFAALRFRHRLFPEEAGAQEVETVLPTGLRLEGLQYSGPFSRVSVYPAFIGKGNPEPRKTQKCTKSCSGAASSFVGFRAPLWPNPSCPSPPEGVE